MEDETIYEYIRGVGWVPEACIMWQLKMMEEDMSRAVFRVLTAPVVYTGRFVGEVHTVTITGTVTI